MYDFLTSGKKKESTMNQKDVQSALEKVIGDIQQNSALGCPPLGSATVPAYDVPKFDSKIWIAATTLLSTKLNVHIPDDVNLFFDKKSKTAKNIGQITQAVCALMASQNSEDAA